MSKLSHPLHRPRPLPRLYTPENCARRMFWLRSVALVLLVAWLALLVTRPAAAATLSPADEKAVRTVVQAQLDAFARDDAKKAWSFAATNVREMTGSPESFMEMVRKGYPVVYRNTSVSFLKPETLQDQVIQKVQLVDASGDAWLASYALQRQKDKSWRITGCLVVENKGRFV